MGENKNNTGIRKGMRILHPASRVFSVENPVPFGDFRQAEAMVPEQPVREGRALVPGVSLVLVNTRVCYLDINVVKAEGCGYISGYHYGYGDRGEGRWPAPHIRGSRFFSSFRACILAALENLRALVLKRADASKSGAVRMIDTAIREVKKVKTRQMSIFDLLD